MESSTRLKDFRRAVMRWNEAGLKVVGVGVKTPRWLFGVFFAAALLLCACLTWTPAMAQTGGQGAISGTVTDSTGVETKRTASSGGLYSISPLIPGTYTVTVTASGFSIFKQENLVVDALSNV